MKREFLLGAALALMSSAASAAEGAAAPGDPQGGLMGMAIPIALFVAIFYFMIFRPQKKRQKEQEKMIDSISRGNTVITAGGFFGRVCEVLEDSFVIELADGVKVRILKTSISMKRDDPGAGSKAIDRPRRKKRRPRPEGDARGEAQGEHAPQSEGVTASESAMLAEDGASAESAPAPQDSGETPSPKTE